jgi:sulfur-carrier protein
MPTTAAVRIELPAHLRTLARVGVEVTIPVALDAEGRITPRVILDALEAAYPTLRGTIRDQVTHERRPFLRFFACGEDRSHDSLDAPMPDEIATGKEPFLIVGAIAGG